MAVATPSREQQLRLVFFHSKVSGNCRRVEGFVAQVLQRRRNHDTFKVVEVAEEERPDLLERFKVDALPTLVVVEGSTVAGRLESPRGCREIEGFLAPWLT
ncbi:MAG TPA: thioredoxin family protein [Gaiellaceae bacterium]|jgi:thioredoxin-like negative regulator of GroEL